MTKVTIIRQRRPATGTTTITLTQNTIITICPLMNRLTTKTTTTRVSLIHLGGNRTEGPKNHQVNLFSNFVKSNQLPVAIVAPMAITTTTTTITEIMTLESRTAISITAPSIGTKWKPLGTMFREITHRWKWLPCRTTITTTRPRMGRPGAILTEASQKVNLPVQRAAFMTDLHLREVRNEQRVLRVR